MIKMSFSFSFSFLFSSMQDKRQNAFKWYYIFYSDMLCFTHWYAWFVQRLPSLFLMMLHYSWKIIETNWIITQIMWKIYFIKVVVTYRLEYVLLRLASLSNNSCWKDDITSNQTICSDDWNDLLQYVYHVE